MELNGVLYDVSFESIVGKGIVWLMSDGASSMFSSGLHVADSFWAIVVGQKCDILSPLWSPYLAPVAVPVQLHETQSGEDSYEEERHEKGYGDHCYLHVKGRLRR